MPETGPVKASIYPYPSWPKWHRELNGILATPGLTNINGYIDETYQSEKSQYMYIYTCRDIYKIYNIFIYKYRYI